MHKPECVLENETHRIIWENILWGFEIKTDHLIPAKTPDVVLINKKERTGQLVDFAVLADHRGKMKGNENMY